MADIIRLHFLMHFLVRKFLTLIPISLHFNNPTCQINNEAELLQLQLPRKAYLDFDSDPDFLSRTLNSPI